MKKKELIQWIKKELPIVGISNIRGFDKEDLYHIKESIEDLKRETNDTFLEAFKVYVKSISTSAWNHGGVCTYGFILLENLRDFQYAYVTEFPSRKEALEFLVSDYYRLDTELSYQLYKVMDDRLLWKVLQKEYTIIRKKYSRTEAHYIFKGGI